MTGEDATLAFWWVRPELLEEDSVDSADWKLQQDVYGCYYHCDECLDFDLCFKCFGHVGKIHPSHKFSQVGTALASQAPIEMTRKLIEPEIPLAPLGASANGYGAPEVADLSASESVVVGRA